MPNGVYVAGSSAEIDRARKWILALQEKGVIVNSTWTDNVKKVGEANPRDASNEDKQAWCLKDVREAIGSSVMWLLMPSGPHSFGAAFEMGFFSALADPEIQQSIVSGDYKRSIFTSFSDRFDTDEQAFDAIVQMFESAGEIESKSA